jgi:hypothetical protein
MNFYEAWQAMLAGKTIIIKDCALRGPMSLTHGLLKAKCPLTGQEIQKHVLNKLYYHMPNGDKQPVNNLTADDITRFMGLEWEIER